MVTSNFFLTLVIMLHFDVILPFPTSFALRQTRARFEGTRIAAMHSNINFTTNTELPAEGLSGDELASWILLEFPEACVTVTGEGRPPLRLQVTCNVYAYFDNAYFDNDSIGDRSNTATALLHCRKPRLPGAPAVLTVLHRRRLIRAQEHMACFVLIMQSPLHRRGGFEAVRRFLRRDDDEESGQTGRRIVCDGGFG